MFKNKKYIIFDLDGTLIESNDVVENIVIDHLFEKHGVEKDKSKYYISQTQGTALQKVVQDLAEIPADEAAKSADIIYKKIQELEKGNFFKGAIEIVRKLSKDYTLFLSTGNSTKFARDNLQEGGILELFKKVQGSDVIPKSTQHIELFKQSVDDPDFEKLAVFIGDGANDRTVSSESAIDFIHIDPELKNTHSDKWEVRNVTEILPYFTK